MVLKKRSNFDSAYLDRCSKAKLKPEIGFINELVDVLMEDIKQPLTIEGIKASLKMEFMIFIRASIQKSTHSLLIIVKKGKNYFLHFFQK